MSRENVELVRRAYERLGENDPLGDWSWFFEEFAHDDLELRPAGTYLDAAPRYQGRNGWAQFWQDFSSGWEEWHFDADAFEFFDAGEKVVVFARSVGIGSAGGIEVTQDEAHVWTVRDGRMLLAVSYMDSEEALEAAGLRESE
jgi:ketosteroid isomerase-like protein